MRNKFHINRLSPDKQGGLKELLDRLPAEIISLNDPLPWVVVEPLGEEHNYAIIAPKGYKVRTTDRNCVFLQEPTKTIDLGGEQINCKDYIDFADLKHPQKVS